VQELLYDPCKVDIAGEKIKRNKTGNCADEKQGS
jgi:hypothetical protein